MKREMLKKLIDSYIEGNQEWVLELIMKLMEETVLPGEGICPYCGSLYNISVGCCEVPGIPDKDFYQE